MAIASVGSLGSVGDTSAGTSIALTTSATAEAGNLVIVAIGKDNSQTTDGQTSEVSSITDSAGGNTWTKLGEYCNGEGSAAAGAVVSLWASILANQIASSGTITANFSHSPASSAISAWEFTIGAGSTISVSSLQVLANDFADPGSMAISGLSNVERLYFRATALERNTGIWTVTASYTAISIGLANTGTSGTSMEVGGEFRILTGTGDTSDPTWAAADCASVYVAILETAAATGQPTMVRSFGVPFARAAGFGGARIGG